MSLDPEPPPLLPLDDPPLWAHRLIALVEVLICSDFPTQLALGATFTALGYGPYAGGKLQVGYVVGLSVVDTAVLIGLIVVFLRAHGERPADVLFGRPVAPEIVRGMGLILPALAIGIVVLVGIMRFAPGLHTVQHNPLQDLLRSPRDAWLFAAVVVIAGGVREEIQRAFLLHRFDMWLGGGAFGVIATSLAFGTGHLLQGADAAIATGSLGAVWGWVYLRRGSAIAPMVSHAGFDLLQIVQYLSFGR